MKRCPHCERLREPKYFNKDSSRKDGRCVVCTTCMREERIRNRGKKLTRRKVYQLFNNWKRVDPDSVEA